MSGVANASGVVATDTITSPGTSAGNFTTVTASSNIQAASSIAAATTVAVPAGGSANCRITVSSTAGLGVYFGSGAPTVSAAKGSLYMRTDGSTISDRAYVNTDGATTWTNLVTAA